MDTRKSIRRRRFAIEMLESRRLLTAGELDLTFGTDGRVLTDFGQGSTEFGYSIAAYQSNGKFVVAGEDDGSGDFAVVRYNNDGSLDTSFGLDGIVTIDFGGFAFAQAVVVDSSDRIVVAGNCECGQMAVARLTTSGALDTAFGTNGMQFVDFGISVSASALALDSVGRVLVVGYTDSALGESIDFAVARLTNGGELDTAFDMDGKQTVDFGSQYDLGGFVAVDSFDRVLVSGWSDQGGTTGYDFAVARLTSVGTLDTAFDADGKQTVDFGSDFDVGANVAVDSADRVLLAGWSDQGATGYDFAVARLSTSGALDTSFDTDGKQTVDFGSDDDSYGSGVVVDSASNVLVVGRSYQGATGYDFAVARLTTNGVLDTSFDTDGKQTVDFGSNDDQAAAVAVDSQGRILLAGGSVQNTTNNDFAVARLLGDNLSPVANAGGPYSIAEGSALLLNGSSSYDPDPLDTLTYSWDVNGDGVFGDAIGVSPILTWTQLQVLGINDGPRTVPNVRVRVDDAHAHVVDSPVTMLTVTNVPPVLETLSATSVLENGTVHLRGTYHDVGTQDTHTLTINWGEGAPQTVSVSGGSFDITHQYLDDNPTNTASDVYTIDVTLTDDSGPTPNLVHLYQFNGNLNDSVGNIPLTNNGGTLNPTSLSFGPNQGPTLIAEAGLAGNYAIGMRVSLSDAEFYRKVIDFSNLTSDNGQYFSQNTSSDPQSYLEFYPFLVGPTNFDLDATVDVVFSRDGDSGLFTMYLNGSAEGSFTDSDGDAIASLIGSDAIFRFFQDDLPTNQEEASAGTVDEIRIWDGPLTGWASASTSVTVSNVAAHDVMIAASVSELVFAVGSSQPFGGSFNDVGTLDTHTAVWKFTHSNASGATVNETRTGSVTQGSGNGTVSNSFSFTEAGVYQVTLTVTDDDSGTTSSVTSLFVVYDPSAGFVTGGGWINSPAGAYVANRLLTGKTNFGFNSKYQNGNNVPTGNTEFQFKVADFNFKSNSYDWLVVSGAKARFRGVGTVNGAGSYGFELTAIDGQVNGGGGVDKFRIKIWNGNPSNVVYDNQMNAPNGADPTTALGGGSIVIHKSGQNLVLDAAAISAPNDATRGDDSQLFTARAEAVTHWAAQGIDAAQLQFLQNLNVVWADLPGNTLGLASESTNYVWIDSDAAGYGWSMNTAVPQAGFVDLFSTLTHELGHVLGYDHDVLGESLHIGERQWLSLTEYRFHGDLELGTPLILGVGQLEGTLRLSSMSRVAVDLRDQVLAGWSPIGSRASGPIKNPKSDTGQRLAESEGPREEADECLDEDLLAELAIALSQ